MSASVYLDHNASAPLEPRVLEAMLPFMRGQHGNASSLHRAGRRARNALDAAREQVATLAGASAAEVVFTSGGTEANALALRGAGEARAPGRLLVSAVEHSSVLEAARALSRAGWTLELIPVDRDCRVDLAALDALLRPQLGKVALVSVMLANNETGVVQDIAAVAARCRAADALLHVDAAQAGGRLAIDMRALGCQLLTLSAHKLHGPQGAGALLRDRAVPLAPLLAGGGQEQGLRGGTEPVAALVGFGAAAALAAAELPARAAAMLALRTRLEAGLRRLPDCTLIAEAATRLPNTVQFALAGHDGAATQMTLDKAGFAVSTGSACHAGRPSHVLAAMGLPAAVAQGAVRVSLGKDNDAAEVDAFVAAVAAVGGRRPAAATG
jgi:cysteine desulfurase